MRQKVARICSLVLVLLCSRSLTSRFVSNLLLSQYLALPDSAQYLRARVCALQVCIYACPPSSIVEYYVQCFMTNPDAHSLGIAPSLSCSRSGWRLTHPMTTKLNHQHDALPPLTRFLSARDEEMGRREQRCTPCSYRNVQVCGHPFCPYTVSCTSSATASTCAVHASRPVSSATPTPPGPFLQHTPVRPPLRRLTTSARLIVVRSRLQIKCASK